jgi:diadenosine tetraphosphatase ApaH/serine/threonine PP2A family protein phosphatase
MGNDRRRHHDHVSAHCLDVFFSTPLNLNSRGNLAELIFNHWTEEDPKYEHCLYPISPLMYSYALVVQKMKTGNQNTHFDHYGNVSEGPQ